MVTRAHAFLGEYSTRDLLGKVLGVDYGLGVHELLPMHSEQNG